MGYPAFLTVKLGIINIAYLVTGRKQFLRYLDPIVILCHLAFYGILVFW